MLATIRPQAQLILGANLKDPEVASRLLAILENAQDIAPTHWGAARGLRDPYDRAAVLAALAGAGDEGIVPNIMRSRPPAAYNIQWFGNDTTESVHSLQIACKHYSQPEELLPFFKLVDSIAAAFPLDWGHLDIVFDGAPPALRMQHDGSYVHLGYYLRFGLTCLFARNYLGPRLLALSDQLSTLLKGTSAATESLDNGVIRLDLLPEPWAKTPDALKAAQLDITAALQPTGIFARPKVNRSLDMAGPRWLTPTDEELQAPKG